MSSVLILDDVTAGYVGDIDVLRSLSLTVEAGSITGLIGLNGAGKSTVMKAICGFLKPKSGRIDYAGQDITGIAPHHLRTRGIWYIPQESSLFPFMTVTENLRLPLEGISRATGEPTRAEVDDRFAEMLAKFPALPPKLRAQAGAPRRGGHPRGGKEGGGRCRRGWPDPPPPVPHRRTLDRPLAEDCRG